MFKRARKPKYIRIETSGEIVHRGDEDGPYIVGRIFLNIKHNLHVPYGEFEHGKQHCVEMTGLDYYDLRHFIRQLETFFICRSIKEARTKMDEYVEDLKELFALDLSPIEIDYGVIAEVSEDND